MIKAWIFDMWDKEHGVCSVMADNIFPKTGWYVWDLGDV